MLLCRPCLSICLAALLALGHKVLGRLLSTSVNLHRHLDHFLHHSHLLLLLLYQDQLSSLTMAIVSCLLLSVVVGLMLLLMNDLNV